MLKIDNKALDYVKGQNLCFFVKCQIDDIKCDCCRTEANFKKIDVKVMYESEIKNYYEDYEDNYNICEYKNVKIFVPKSIKLEDDAIIYEKVKLPFRNPSFAIKGASF
ncbi:hypothetical protein D4Z93_07330 [Clostridium fermenticellae]|uniref:Uncharacterized protein n=1 Tax=Clostridium fermenticellae TaxID=2068654 RepID=A0A386H482_9CLOT|nr:hypothetical protein [Clostridium fermenticellae]AYD40343.1 hypothetical protein D4Z93_07330 [Clostridium fermenticellae]